MAQGRNQETWVQIRCTQAQKEYLEMGLKAAEDQARQQMPALARIGMGPWLLGLGMQQTRALTGRPFVMPVEPVAEEKPRKRAKKS